ncbi:DUF6059 family protein [Streptomyces sp. AC602_WCS936]|uniref:DUF6059 family protein n=1 Tax=Streptomyces sp. AC602_WCS936 TaxID=2823685 RepID=UPI001C26D0A3|nr:DUF6059 family protein [Streptomyces sp. AC602_WCS936]
MAFRGARRLWGVVRALRVRLWQGLVALGALQAAGEQARADAARGLDAPRVPDAPPLLDAPPPGHPERLRPDLPLTALERALLQELDAAG